MLLVSFGNATPEMNETGAYLNSKSYLDFPRIQSD